MGGWKMEVCKIALYITFPVGLFYVFNQPQYFDKWVTEARSELYKPEEVEGRRKFREEIQNFRRLKMEKELLKKLEDLK